MGRRATSRAVRKIISVKNFRRTFLAVSRTKSTIARYLSLGGGLIEKVIGFGTWGAAARSIAEVVQILGARLRQAGRAYARPPAVPRARRTRCVCTGRRDVCVMGLRGRRTQTGHACGCRPARHAVGGPCVLRPSLSLAESQCSPSRACEPAPDVTSVHPPAIGEYCSFESNLRHNTATPLAT
eukprot:698420-Prymnesium_polylepis.1